ncbi:hypothetical protein EIP86_002744 [Pleurotus ostreatoroseus]|nr:hypothetical protein EIP86_002744 [Pleurotus ostreatoroseus]
MDRLAQSHLPSTHHDRTSEWVSAQVGQAYDSLPPSPTTAATTMSMRMAASPSSNRTTASSEQSLATASTNFSSASMRHRRGSERHAAPLHTSPVANFSGSTVPPASLSARDQVRMPFPQSPPGSGYPLMLEVAPPRTEPDRSASKVRAITMCFGFFVEALTACATVSREETQAIVDRPDQGNWGAEHALEARG